MISVDDFEKQIDNIEYKGEIYSARDNGSVMRLPKTEKARPLDNKWTFGKQSVKTGYMEIGGERVHRIVATGFLGEAPSKEHVIDHIDTNRANNRPENLRWVTKLENILLNETTRKRIEYVCGSVEEFLNNPAEFRNKFSDPNISWMCTVSKEEAHNCLKNLQEWSVLEIGNPNREKQGSLGKWIFKPQASFIREPSIINKSANTYNFFENNIEEYFTPNTEQNWPTPTRFPCCPAKISDTPLQDYFNNLQEGSIFGENRYTKYIVVKTAMVENKIIVFTEDAQEGAIKPWCISNITFENNIFYHSKIKTCFDPNGAEKYFTLEQGLEWTGKDSIDDYC